MFLEKIFRKRPAQPKTTDRDFAIEWNPADLSRCGEVRDAAVLITDSAPVCARDLKDMRKAVGNPATPLVIVGPGYGEECLPAMANQNIFGIVASDIGVQPMEDLLSDLAMYTSGKPLFSALGTGMPAPDKTKTASGLILPGVPWLSLTPADLGKASAVTLSEGRASFRTDSSRHTTAHLQSLVNQFRRAVDDVERESIARRFVRFGRPQPEMPAVAEDPALAPVNRIAGGLASSFFVTDADRRVADLKNPRILILGFELEDIRDGIAVGELILKRDGAPVVVMAPAITGPALALLTVNKMCGILPVTAVEIPAESMNRSLQLTGSQFVEAHQQLLSLNESSFGRVARFVAGRHWLAVAKA